MSLSLKKWTSGKSISLVRGSASPFIDKGDGFTGERERVRMFISLVACNTPGVCHQLSNGFELKHDMSSGNEGVKIKST